MIKRDPKLFSKLEAKIEKNVWYRQRFDACPHFMFFLGDAHISNIQDSKYPFGQRITYAGFSKNRADWYHSLEELKYTTSKILQAAKKDAKISEHMVKAFKKPEAEFYKLCLKLGKTDLADLTNKQLLRIYTDLSKVYTDKLNASPLIDGFALTTDGVIAEKIRNFLNKNGPGDRFAEYFEILTAPVFLSFLQLQEIELLKTAGKIHKNPKLAEKLIKEHQGNYFWIQNNYVKDHVAGAEFFGKSLKKFKKKDIKNKIREIQRIRVDNKKAKSDLSKKLRLTSEIRLYLKITDDFNQWQDERKKGTFWATHYFSLLLSEISKRTNYTLEQLKYSFPPEIGQILENKIDPKELERRFRYCMILWVPGRYDVMTNLKFINKLDQIGTGKHSPIQEINGFSASLGYAKGRVKIVESAEEVNKVKKGDVIVAVMTRPDYLPAMKRAAAFVTDEGGITCHAAIVAREMKKPCVIGTKVATKILKDGDMVEVDASKGTVRKI